MSENTNPDGQPQSTPAGSSHPYIQAQPNVQAHAPSAPTGYGAAPEGQYVLPQTHPLHAPAQAQPTGQTEPQLQGPVEKPEGTAPESVNGEYEFSDAVSQGLYQGLSALADSKGVDLIQAFGPAYESGNPAFINHAYLQSVAPELAGVLVQQATALINHESTRSQQTVDSVYQMAGGSEQWGSAVQQFNSGAPQEVRDVIRGLLDSGNPANLKYAVQAVLGYSQSTGQVPFQQGAQVNPAQTQQSGYGQVMTKEAFFKAETALGEQYGIGTAEYMKQFEALAVQRQQARQRGQ